MTNKKPNSTLKELYNSLTVKEKRLFKLALVYLAGYWIVLISFPIPLLDTVIYSIAIPVLTIEGFLIALSPSIKNQSIRDWVSVGVGVPAILLSLSTIAKAYVESLQYQWLSWVPTTSIFILDNMLFSMMVVLYAFGALSQGLAHSQQ